MPIYNVPEAYLRKAVASVVNQVYPRWELCIADDNSTLPYIRPMLEEFAKQDSRIKVLFREQNGHISACSNSALSLARGEWCALLDQDDKLAENALAEVACEIAADIVNELIGANLTKAEAAGAVARAAGR